MFHDEAGDAVTGWPVGERVAGEPARVFQLRVDHSELEDARWFPGDALPNRPSRHSIAGYIMQHYANPRRS